MKRKLFSILLAICLLTAPLTALGAVSKITINEPAATSENWILNESFGSSFTDSLIYNKTTERNHAKKATVNGESCLKVYWVESYAGTRAYPAPLKTVDTDISDGIVVYKGKFLIPGEETQGTEQPNFAIQKYEAIKGASWDDPTTFAVQFDAENGKVEYQWKDDSDTLHEGNNNASISKGLWHEVIIVLDLTENKASTYLDGNLVVDTSIGQNAVAKHFGVGAGFGSIAGAVSYVDDIQIFKVSNPSDIEIITYEKAAPDDSEILGYYAYDDFSDYIVGQGHLIYPTSPWSYPSDTTKYDIPETVMEENGNKFIQMRQSWWQTRAFKLYSPLKDGYAHMHVDVKLENAGAIATIGLGKNEIAANSAGENPRANPVNAAMFAENKIKLMNTVTTNTFDSSISSTYIEVATPFSLGEWHTVDFLFDMEKKQFDIFVDGTPRIVDLYFTYAQDDPKNAPVADFEYKSAVIGLGDGMAAGTNLYFDNLFVADVTGKYVADMFETGYKKLLQAETLSVGDTRYLTESFLLPYNGYARGEDINLKYSTTNSGINIYERYNFSPYDDMRVSIAEGALGTNGSFTANIKKGGVERTVTIPMNLLPEMAASAANPVLNVSAFTVDGSITANGEVTAKGLIENTSESDETVQVLLAVYYGTQLKAVKVESLTAKAGKINELKTESLTLPENLPTGCTAKAFVWNLGTLKAIVPVQ